VKPFPTTVEGIYAQHLAAGYAMSFHMPHLRTLAEGLEQAVEFGVNRGCSSAALLAGGVGHLLSYDIRVKTPAALALEVAAGARWDYRIGDSRTGAIPPCDLLLVDSLHTYAQVEAELAHAADQVRRWLIFHDSISFGSVGANGETGHWVWSGDRPPIPATAIGIRPAIDALMIRDDSWRIASHETASHGLLVLERR
jgi:hypothetical protein